MATESQKTVPEAGISEIPSDAELFAGNVRESLSERDVFVGDEDFYKSLASSAQPGKFHIGSIDIDTNRLNSSVSAVSTRVKQFSTVQKTLTAGIAFITVVLLFTFIKSFLKPVVESAESVTPVAQSSQEETSVEPAEDILLHQPLSLKIAEEHYLQGDYKKAYTAYDQLRQALPANVASELLNDFLELKMAFCARKAGNIKLADSLFTIVSKSQSLVVRTVANYHRSLLEMQKGRYLQARTKAYQTLALINAVDFDENLTLWLQRNCHFLVAEAITRCVLTLRDADKSYPEGLWSNTNVVLDPFTGLDESKLRPLLKSGTEKLGEGLLGPQIQNLEFTANLPSSAYQYIGFGMGAPCWSVVCHGASIEELLARFAANASLDINWVFDGVSNHQLKETSIRQRSVSLYLPESTMQQFAAVAAGSVGLLARFDNNPTGPAVNIFNPADYSSLAECISLLGQEAVSLWQRFLFKFHDDNRIANAHFALGLLQAQRDRPNEAIAEYKLVANRFSQTFLAPFALLRASILKADLHDYFGAREGFKQLVEQYPDAPVSDNACLYLADVTMNAGLKAEAGRLYEKVYHLSLPLQSQIAAALGAGRCFFEIADYKAAEKWLTRYIALAEDRTSRDSHLVYFLLGKTRLILNNPQQACEAFQVALNADMTRQEHIDTISALVETQIQQERFIEALGVLEDVPSAAFSQGEFTEVLLLKSRILRSMGLFDRAIALLGDRVEYISDSQLKAKVSLELTRCYIAKGQWGLARDNLTEILVYVGAGPLAHEVALELAEVCLNLGQDSQTITVCLQLLDLAPSMQIKQKTLNLLATAYRRQKNYDRAAAALLGRWNGLEAR